VSSKSSELTLEHDKHFVLCMNLTIPCKTMQGTKQQASWNSMGAKTMQGTKPQGTEQQASWKWVGAKLCKAQNDKP
jgi:hypothetical protein